MSDGGASAPIDRRRRDPEVRKERVKLVANALNALGVALIIGAFVAPFVGTAAFHLGRSLVAALAGFAFVVAAVTVLRYIKG